MKSVRGRYRNGTEGSGSAPPPYAQERPATRPKRPCKTEQDFLDDTLAVWQPRAPRPLSREDAREIAHNAIGFFSLLRAWTQAELDNSGEELSHGGLTAMPNPEDPDLPRR